MNEEIYKERKAIVARVRRAVNEAKREYWCMWWENMLGDLRIIEAEIDAGYRQSVPHPPSEKEK